MTSLGGWLPLSLSGNVHNIEEARQFRARTKWMRVPHGTRSAALTGRESTDPAPTIVRRTDAEIVRITAMAERYAVIGRHPEDDPVTSGRGEGEPAPLTPADPDLFAEGALAMARYFLGQVDEVGLLLNWATGDGASDA